MNFSPDEGGGNLLADSRVSGYDGPGELPNEDIKVKLFFHTERDQLLKKVFPEEWYTVMSDQYEGEEVSTKLNPWLEVSNQYQANHKCSMTLRTI